MDLLNLPGYQFLAVEETEFEIRITIRMDGDPAVCQRCGIVSSLTHYGTKNQLFNDLPIRAKRVGLHIVESTF